MENGKLDSSGYEDISDLIPALERYVFHRVECGGFLNAVLENNLKESFGRADDHNQVRLFRVVHFLYNRIPKDAWGSRERVTNWLNGKAV